jgi:hypothetical protein
MGASTVWRRFLRWSRARVRPAGGTRARRGSGEDRGAGCPHGGADWALPARARRWPALMCAHPRASACKDQDAVTSAQIAALRATHHPDGAGARAVEAEMQSAPR